MVHSGFAKYNRIFESNLTKYLPVDKMFINYEHLIFLLTIPRQYFFCESFFLFMFHVCHSCAVLSVPWKLVITCWEKADLLALLCVVFSDEFVTFPYGFLVFWVRYGT